MKWYALSLILVASASAIAERPERNAFINYSVHSVRELVIEVQKDPEVCARYSRHFGMNSEQLVTYFSCLHSSRLQSSGVYDVYSIPPDGHVKMHHQRIHAGVPVFCDASGKPIMLVHCGNPLCLGPSRGEVEIGGPASPGVPLVERPPVETEVPTPDLALTPPPTPRELYVPPTVAAVCPAPPPVEVEVHNGDNGGLLLGAVAIGGLIGLSTLHNHDCCSCPTPPVNPVPEPSTYALMGLGLTGVLLKRRKKA